jgi:hypothetical protein
MNVAEERVLAAALVRAMRGTPFGGALETIVERREECAWREQLETAREMRNPQPVPLFSLRTEHNGYATLAYTIAVLLLIELAPWQRFARVRKALRTMALVFVLSFLLALGFVLLVRRYGLR